MVNTIVQPVRARAFWSMEFKEFKTKIFRNLIKSNRKNQTILLTVKTLESAMYHPVQLNLIKLNRNQIVITIFRLEQQTDCVCFLFQINRKW